MNGLIRAYPIAKARGIKEVSGERSGTVEQPSRPRQTRQPSRPRQPGGLNQHAEGTSTSGAVDGRTVAEVLACWPQTAPVFMRYRLACVGCSLARFELITDVAAIYGINPAGFLHELQQAIEGGHISGDTRRER